MSYSPRFWSSFLAFCRTGPFLAFFLPSFLASCPTGLFLAILPYLPNPFSSLFLAMPPCKRSWFEDSRKHFRKENIVLTFGIKYSLVTQMLIFFMSKDDQRAFSKILLILNVSKRSSLQRGRSDTNNNRLTCNSSIYTDVLTQNNSKQFSKI